jgi:hypothetical protein
MKAAPAHCERWEPLIADASRQKGVRLMHIVTPLPAPRHVRHAGRSPQIRSEAYASLAAAFTRQGWTPEEMRAYEQVFGATPVADAMKAAVR